MATLTVGASQTYSTIHDAVAASQDGDVVEVQAGTYTNDFTTIQDSITVNAVGGTVHVVATTAPPDGKAIFSVGGSGKTVAISGFEFSGAAVADGNGAGIRYQGGSLTLTNTYFHDNQDGLLGAADPSGSITIRNSEFSHNGTGDGQTHNLYVNNIAQLTIDNSYFHDAVVGHEIKSRAQNTTITNTRIFDNDATASYSIDLPNAGNATIKNNVIQQGPNSQNQHIIAYGEEGAARPGRSLEITGNTVVNDLQSNSARLLWNASDATATISSNTIFGLTAGQLAQGSASVSGTTFLGAAPALDRSSLWQGSTGASSGPTETGSSVSPSPSSDRPSSLADTSGTLASPAAALFDVRYYLSHNPDVAAAGVDPLSHYNEYGWHEGRDPSAQFDTSSYLAANADVAAAGVNPLQHYVEFGAAEGRIAFAAPA